MKKATSKNYSLREVLIIVHTVLFFLYLGLAITDDLVVHTFNKTEPDDELYVFRLTKTICYL